MNTFIATVFLQKKNICTYTKTQYKNIYICRNPNIEQWTLGLYRNLKLIESNNNK